MGTPLTQAAAAAGSLTPQHYGTPSWSKGSLGSTLIKKDETQSASGTPKTGGIDQGSKRKGQAGARVTQMWFQPRRGGPLVPVAASVKHATPERPAGASGVVLWACSCAQENSNETTEYQKHMKRNIFVVGAPEPPRPAPAIYTLPAEAAEVELRPSGALTIPFIMPPKLSAPTTYQRWGQRGQRMAFSLPCLLHAPCLHHVDKVAPSST